MSTSSVVAEMVADAQEFLDGGSAALSGLLEEVATYGDRPVPTPSAELALLLAGRPAVPRPATPVRVRARRTVAGLAAAAVAGLSVTGAAAVANELPVPAQRAVAHFSEQFLPFSFPRPVGDPPAGRDATSTRPGPRHDAPSGRLGSLSRTVGGSPAEPGSSHPGPHAGHISPKRTTGVRPAPETTTHRETAPANASSSGPSTGPSTAPSTGPSTGPGGAQARGTTPAAAHDPAVATGAPQAVPDPQKQPSGKVAKGHARAGTGDPGKGPEAAPQGVAGDGSDGTGRGHDAPVTAPTGQGAAGAGTGAQTGRSAGRSATPGSDQDAALQDGSGSPTP